MRKGEPHGTIKVILLAMSILLASSAFAQKRSPDLVETLKWIQTSLAAQGSYYMAEETRSVKLVKFSGCRVMFLYTTTKDSKETYRQEISLNLADIDSDTGLFGKFENTHDGLDDLGIFTASTRNDEKKVHIKVMQSNMEFDDTGLIFEFHSEYGHKFSKAFRHAASLCGAKPSLF
jgi:hypothetical protein